MIFFLFCIACEDLKSVSQRENKRDAHSVGNEWHRNWCINKWHTQGEHKIRQAGNHKTNKAGQFKSSNSEEKYIINFKEWKQCKIYYKDNYGWAQNTFQTTLFKIPFLCFLLTLTGNCNPECSIHRRIW